MPQYLVTAPTGQKFKITAPEGASQEDALAYAQKQFAQQSSAKPTLAQSNPGEYDPNSAEFSAKYGPTAGSSFLENLKAGVGKAIVDTGRGVKQLALEGADKLGLAHQDLNDAVRGETVTDRVRREASESAAQDAPLMKTGGGVLGDIAGQVALSAAPAGAITKGASLAARLGSAAATGAAFANTQPVTTEQTRLGNSAAGAIGGAVGEGAASAIGRLASSANKITPEIQALAEKARDMGIPLRAEQISGSRPLAGVSAALDTLPLSGRDAARQAQRVAFNKAVSRTFGESGDNLTTAVRDGEKNLGAKYDAVLKRYSVNADEPLLEGLEGVLQNAHAELSDSQFGVISRQTDNILDKVDSLGQIDAQAAYNLKKGLDRMAQGQDSSLAYHARELRDALMEALDRSLPSKVSQNFTRTKEQYANLISVRRLLKNGADGGVTPAALGNVKRLRGDLKDVADVGATFLKEPFGNSGTANRMVGAGLIGGAGVAGLLEPTTLAATGATLAAGRLTNKALGSQALGDYLLYGLPSLRKALPYIRPALTGTGATLAIASQ